jgi:chromosomal replication initiator protein
MKLNRDCTFQNYLVSDNKKDARKAISSAMALPGQIYNPIFIYGSVGVGKTHLLQALAQEYKTDLKIYYVSVEQFVNDIVQAIQNYRYVDFVKQCLNLDVLLIDDIHLVKDKKSTLEELLHIFERLYNAQKQIVITADRPITQIFKTKGKAVRIFQKGLVLNITPPAYSDRLRFLQLKAQNAGLVLSSDVLEDLARKTNPDFRELQGILAKTKLRYELIQG